MASVLQRLLVEPLRLPDLDLVRSMGLGDVSLRSLGLRPRLRLGLGARARLLARLGLLDVWRWHRGLGTRRLVGLPSAVLQLGVQPLSQSSRLRLRLLRP